MRLFWNVIYICFGMMLLSVIALICSIIYSKSLLYTTASEYIVNNVIDLEPAQAVIILGAKVYDNGRLSPVLKDRADLALNIYRQKKAKKFLISGDNGSNTHNEIAPLYKYLKKFNIPDDDIFVDFAGFDTQDSMYRAAHNFQIQTLIIPTQSRFIYRSVFLAKSYGIAPQGIVTLYDYMPNLFLGRHAREDIASIKAVLESYFQKSALIASSDIYPITLTGNSGLFFGKK